MKKGKKSKGKGRSKTKSKSRGSLMAAMRRKKGKGPKEPRQLGISPPLGPPPDLPIQSVSPPTSVSPAEPRSVSSPVGKETPSAESTSSSLPASSPKRTTGKRTGKCDHAFAKKIQARGGNAICGCGKVFKADLKASGPIAGSTPSVPPSSTSVPASAITSDNLLQLTLTPVVPASVAPDWKDTDLPIANKTFFQLAFRSKEIRETIAVLTEEKEKLDRDVVLALSLADVEKVAVADIVVTLITRKGSESLDKAKLKLELHKKLPADVVASCFQAATRIGDPTQFPKFERYESQEHK